MDAVDAVGEIDYCRVRLWGSLSLIAVAIGAGKLLAGRPPEIIYWILLATLALVAAVTLALPATRAPAASGGRFAAIEVLRDSRFRLFIAATALIQASHGVYYGFGTLNWQAQGYSETIIGWLWAVGVVAEIILFVFGARLVGVMGPARLIALGGLAGAVRWSVTGLTAGLGILVVMQALHAFTFAATHLGAIYFISRRVPPALSASAQGLYSAMVMGLALGAAILLSGKLFALYGAGAYHAMAAMAALGTAAAVLLINKR